MNYFRGLPKLLFLFALLLLCCELVGFLRPASSGKKERIITIAPGSTFRAVAARMEEEGLIGSRHVFSLLAWWKNATGRIQAGTYRLSASQSPSEILNVFLEGRVLEYLVTIPEGFSTYDIGALLDKGGLITGRAFIDASRDSDLLRSLNIPANSAEGYLYPDTYHVTYRTSVEDAVKKFVGRFWCVWKSEGFDERARELGVTVHDVVILASIVEKEAVMSNERPLIARVFWNRLERGMPLQADPTVTYGMLVESGVRRRHLSKEDLAMKTPYNTYMVKGLPAGPICNPGKASLRAVLYPAKTDYLYFVARNDGTHEFSKTLVEHNKAVNRYQRSRR